MYLKLPPKEAEFWSILGKRHSYDIWLEANEPWFNENTNHVKWYMNDTGGASVSGVGFYRDPDEATGKWFHVAFQAEGNKKWGYFNGELRSRGEVGGRGNPLILPADNDSPFFINFFTDRVGRRFAFHQVKPFDGVLDEVRISSIRRYQDEDISTQIRRKFEPDEHTAALWHFDEAGNAAFYVDASENGNILQRIGGVAVEPKAQLATAWGAIKNRRNSFQPSPAFARTLKSIKCSP